MKTCTIVLIPNSRSKCREFLITHRSIYISAFLFLLFISFFVFLIFSNVRIARSYESALIDKALLETYKNKAKKIDSLVATVSNMQEKVDKLTNVNSQLQTMVGVGSSDVAVGGSTSIDDFEDAYFLNKSKILTNLEAEIDDIMDEATKQSEISESLGQFFEEHTSLLSHLPTLRPVEGGWVSSYFGKRLDPFTKKPAFHYGLDISARRGTEILAPADGIVTFASYEGTYGLMLRIDHGNGFKTYYGHLQDFNVKIGQRISRGDVIAFLGRSGKTRATFALRNKIKW